MTIEMNLQKGLVGHWTMNSTDVNNGVIADRSGYENEGTFNGGSANFPGKSGDSVNFNGGSEHIEISVDPNSKMRQTGDISYSFWINTNSFSPTSNNDFQRAVTFSANNDSSVIIEEAKEINFSVSINTSRINGRAGSLTTDAWYHIVATHDTTTGNHRIYQDSILVGDFTVETGQRDDPGSPFKISDSSRPVRGEIDDVRVYNRVLSPKEINKLYNIRSDRSYGSPFSPPPRGLSPVNPISSMSHVDNDKYDGFKEMFCDFGRNLDSPIAVDVLFGETGGPYIIVSFDIQQAGIGSLNNTVGLIHENDFGGYDKAGDSIDIGLGLGSRDNNNLFHPDNRLPTDGNAGIAASNDFKANSDINYYNHATSDTLTTLQESALRKFAKKLSPATPHAASTVDTDSGQTRDYDAAVNSNFSSARINNGHYVWLESNNKYLGATPIIEANSNNVGFNTWTESTHNAIVSSSPLGNFPLEGVGISDISSEILIPQKYYGDVQTGGGTAFGTPYSKNLNIGDNFRNSRTFFLVRD